MNSFTFSRSFFKQIQLVAFAIVLSLICLCAMPTQTRAAGLTDEQVNAVVSLLQSFNADQATLTRVHAALIGSTLAASSTMQKPRSEIGARPLCELFKRELRRGSRGDDVRELQKFLAQEEGTSTDALVTGFFGERTEAAVKRLQALLGIVSSGDAVSTGYGLVGAKTRAAFVARCMGEDSMRMHKAEDEEDRIGTSSPRDDSPHRNRGRGRDHNEEDDTTSYYKSSVGQTLLASAAASVGAPFAAITDMLSDTFFALGLY